MLNALQRRDIDVKALENSLDFSIPHSTIEDWLVEVSRELSSKGIYALTIYWDEFISLMELENISTIIFCRTLLRKLTTIFSIHCKS